MRLKVFPFVVDFFVVNLFIFCFVCAVRIFRDDVRVQARWSGSNWFWKKWNLLNKRSSLLSRKTEVDKNWTNAKKLAADVSINLNGKMPQLYKHRTTDVSGISNCCELTLTQDVISRMRALKSATEIWGSYDWPVDSLTCLKNSYSYISRQWAVYSCYYRP